MDQAIGVKKIFWKWLIPNNGKSSSHQQSLMQIDCRLITGLSPPQLCHTWTRAISPTHTEQEGVIAFVVLRGWNILDPRWVHALGCWFLMGWTLDSRCHYHLNAHCSGFGATFYLVSRILFKIMAVSCLRIHHRVFGLAVTLPCSSWPLTTEMVGWIQTRIGSESYCLKRSDWLWQTGIIDRCF